MSNQATELHFPTISALNEHMPRSVNARELHTFLEVDSNFTTWIKRRIEDYGFIEKQDFISLSKNGKQDHGFWGGQNKSDYYITLDMAKELAMVERNHKGRLARRHFIEAEKRALQGMADIAKISAEILKARPLWQKIARYKDLGLNHAEISKLVSLSTSAVRENVRRMEHCGIIAPPADLPLLQQRAQHLIGRHHVH